MRSARISLALETGALVLPAAGRIAVFRPREEDDLSALPKAQVEIIQGFRPDHDAFAVRGYRCATEPSGSYAAAFVCLPRAKAEARALVAIAAAHVSKGGLIIVDGQKTDGTDSMLRELRGRVEVSEPVSKAHGKLFFFASRGPEEFTDWRAAAAPRKIEEGFTTVAGVFSADGIDRGSVLLAGALPAKLPKRMADLGAGWGYLARQVLTRPGVEHLDLIEAEKAALDCARLNVTDPRAHFLWEDATRFRPERAYDAIVTNPPFHTSRAADPALGAAFLTAAARMLTTSGTLWLVANRHLPYERVLAEVFREVEEVAGDAAFKVYRASRPVPPARGRR